MTVGASIKEVWTAMASAATSIKIWTDGACSGNPGPGGWGYIIQVVGEGGSGEIANNGGETSTTNNRMELMAAIMALESIPSSAGCAIELHTDSQYVQKGASEWLAGWKRKQWKTGDKKPVKNVDLWKRLDEAMAVHEIIWVWVRGHNGDVMNERVDELARLGIGK